MTTLKTFLKKNLNKLGTTPYDEIMTCVRKNILAEAYEVCGFNIAKTARFLNMNRTSLSEMLQRDGLRKPHVNKVKNSSDLICE
jgi:DNA-binding NtrC family response regulator